MAQESGKKGTNPAPAPIKRQAPPVEYGRMPEAEVQTIRLAQAGHPGAFRDILEAYQKPVMATLYRLLGGRFPQEIEDFAQDVFLKMFKSIGKFDFDRKTKFSTWLYTFVKNYCIDIQKKRRIRTVSLDFRNDEEEKALHLPSNQSTPKEDLSQQELSAAIESAIQSLPSEQRETFVLREYEGLNYDEIGRILNCSEGTVKSRLYRARDALRAKLTPYLREGAAGPLEISPQEKS